MRFVRRGMVHCFDLSQAEAQSFVAGLTFANPAYEKAISQGDPVDKIRKHIVAWRRNEDGSLQVPRNFGPVRGLAQPAIRPRGDTMFSCKSTPRPGQEGVARELVSMEGDVGLQLPCGFGKSFLALYYAARQPGRCLVVAPTSVKLQEWKEQIEIHCGIPQSEIGHVQASTRDWEDKAISVAMINSLAKQDFPEEFLEGFGAVVWDEAHLSGAPVLSQALGRVNGVQIFLTATPGKGVRRELLRLHGAQHWISRRVDVPMRAFFVPVAVDRYTAAKDWRWQKLAVAKNKTYNKVASYYVKRAMSRGRRVLVLHSFIEPLLAIHNDVRQDGGDGGGFVVGASSLKTIKATEVKRMFPDRSWPKATRAYFNHVKASMNPILATGLGKRQPGGVGMDVADLDGGVIMLPVPDPDMVKQMVGRWQREHPTKEEPILVVLFPKSKMGINLAKAMAGHMTRMKVTTQFLDGPPQEAFQWR